MNHMCPHYKEIVPPIMFPTGTLLPDSETINLNDQCDLFTHDNLFRISRVSRMWGSVLLRTS